MNFSLVFVLTSNGISFIACLCFLYCYSAIPKKTIGIKMIFVISLSDSMFHLSILILHAYLQLVKDSLPPSFYEFIFPMMFSFYMFSVAWACNIGFFLYKLLTMKKMPDPINYFNRSLVMIFVLSIMLVIPSGIGMESSNFIYLLFMTICLTLVILFYCKSTAIIKSHSDTMRDAIQIRVIDLYAYSILPFFTVGPMIIGLIPDISTAPNWRLFFNSLIGLTGFTNSMVFFFQRVKSQENNEIAIQYFESFVEEQKGRDSIQILLLAESQSRY